MEVDEGPETVGSDSLLNFTKKEGDTGIMPPSAGLGVAKAPVPDVTPSSTPPKKETDKPKRTRRSPKTTWKKPKDMPRRPLSAYNLFFQYERERMLRETGLKAAAATKVTNSPTPDEMTSSDPSIKEEIKTKGTKSKKGRSHNKSSGIGFANLAKTIAAKWKTIDAETRAPFEASAAKEKERYNKEMVVWRNKKKTESLAKSMTSPSSSTLLRRGSLDMARFHDPFPDSHFSISENFQPKRHSFPGISMMSSNMGNRVVPQLNNDLNLEPIAVEPIAVTSSMLSSYDQPGHEVDMLSAFSDNFLNNQAYDVRPCEEIVADVARRNEYKLEPSTSVTQSSLRNLGSNLDPDTVNFLTCLKFEH